MEKIMNLKIFRRKPLTELVTNEREKNDFDSGDTVWQYTSFERKMQWNTGGWEWGRK
jgi:hypothetical protein